MTVTNAHLWRAIKTEAASEVVPLLLVGDSTLFTYNGQSEGIALQGVGGGYGAAFPRVLHSLGLFRGYSCVPHSGNTMWVHGLRGNGGKDNKQAEFISQYAAHDALLELNPWGDGYNYFRESGGSQFPCGGTLWTGDGTPFDFGSNAHTIRWRYDTAASGFETLEPKFRPVLGAGLGDPSDYTTYSGGTINPNTGAVGITYVDLSLPAKSVWSNPGDLDASLEMRSWTWNQQKSGSFVSRGFGIWPTAMTNGFMYGAVYGVGGQSTRTIAANLQGRTDTRLDNHLSMLIDSATSGRALVVIATGLNDRNETLTSVGPGEVADGDSPEAYIDNVQAIIARVGARLATLDIEPTYLILTPHAVSEPQDSELASYAAAAASFASTSGHVHADAASLVDQATIADFYGDSGTDEIHLTSWPSGYDVIVSALDAAATPALNPGVGLGLIPRRTTGGGINKSISFGVNV